MLVQMLVVHFMCPADGPHISVIAAGKPLKPLMNDNIMHNKIRKPIGHDTKPDGLHPPKMIKSSKVNQQDAGRRKNDEEEIVLLKKTRFGAVMIFVQVPQKTMHHKFMCAPGESFHQNVCAS